MPKLLKKIFFSFFAFLLLFGALAPNFLIASAQTKKQQAPSATPPPTWYSQDFKSWYSKVYDQDTSPGDQIFGERYTAAQVEWVIYGLFAFVIRKTGGESTDCLASNDLNNCVEQLKNFFSGASKGLSQNPPQDKSWASLIFASDRSLSAVNYVRSTVQNFSLVPVAYAQTGFGFSAFNPIINLWRAVRDFSFFLAVLATIILAFMIMFRVKISPQAVITAQSAIPKVIVALIFVAFSYAIAGLLVDLMYVVIGLVSLFFNLIGDPKAVFNIMTNGPAGLGVFSMVILYWAMFTIFLLLGIQAIATGVALSVATGAGNAAGGGTLGGAIGIAAGSILGSAISTVLLFVLFLVTIVTIIVLIIATFKILWLLIKTLAQIYLLVIFGPLQIVMGAALPASGGLGVGAWIRALVSNLIVYPVVGALFVISFIFIKFAADISLSGTAAAGTASDFFNKFLGAKVIAGQAASGWTPPLSLGGPAALPLIFLAVSFVIITLIPKTAEIIQSIVTGKPFGFGMAIGEALGPAKTAAQAGIAYGVSEYEEGLKRQSTIGSILRTIGVVRK